MGIRADFYIRDNDTFVWLGSLAYEGNPENIPNNILEADDPEDFYHSVLDEIDPRDDAYSGNEEWPWTWQNSSMTDYVYTFYQGQVYVTSLGRGNVPWKIYRQVEGNVLWSTLTKCSFPLNMQKIKPNSLDRLVSFGKSS